MQAMAQMTWQRGEPLTMTTLPDPVPKADEVLVRVRAAGVNPVDWKMRTMGPLRLAARLIGPPPPVVVGVDFMGVVEAVGAAITDLPVGTRVCGGTDFSRKQRGSAADTVCVRRDQLIVVPDGVSDDVAGAIGVVGTTAKMSLLDHGGLKAGGRVLVLGASGGVGQCITQLAKHWGAAKVVGVCSGKNAELVSGLGVDEVVDYQAGDPLKAAAAFGPYDIVVDCAGGYAGGASRALLAPKGRHVLVASDGFAGLMQPLVSLGTAKVVLGTPSSKHLQPVMDAIAAGALQIGIASRFALADIEAAHTLSKTGRVTGKIVLQMV